MKKKTTVVYIWYDISVTVSSLQDWEKKWIKNKSKKVTRIETAQRILFKRLPGLLTLIE